MKVTISNLTFTIGMVLGSFLAFDLIAADDLFSSKGQAAEHGGEILPVDEAFRFGSYEDGDMLTVFWQVLPGYYLYRDKFQFWRSGSALEIELPRGVMRQDEIFGEVEVLSGLVQVQVPASQPIEVSYQGCAERGFCYPPQKRSLFSSK